MRTEPFFNAPLNRRILLASTAGLTAAALCTGLQAEEDSAGIELLETRVISRLKQYYHGWPTLARRGNGELLVVCSGGRQRHVCPFGRVELIRSRDEGQSWSFPRVLLDGPIDDRDAGLCETAEGSLLVTTFTSLAYEPTLEKLSGDDLEQWMSVHQRLEADARQKELGVWMIRSTDGGITWSQRFPALVNSPHGPTQLRDGRLLYAGIELWSAERKVGVTVSSDDGRTWQWLAELPVRDGDSSKNYHELHLVECGSGKLVLHIRNHNPENAQETLQSESMDGGQTWSVPRAIGVWGLPSHLLRAADGRLLMSYGYRRPPFGNQVRISDDEGMTWGAPQTLSSDGLGFDLGYPSTVELANGDFYTVWYERMADSPAAVLRGARWKARH